MSMTVDQAWELKSQIDKIQQQLCEAFPCRECSDGTRNPDWPYPEPCSDCWGRGYHIPEDEE